MRRVLGGLACLALAALSCGPGFRLDPLAGLVAVWRLDESTMVDGLKAADSSGNEFHATLFTGGDGLEKSTATAKSGRALTFDGTNDRLVVSESGTTALDFQNGSSITIMAWILPTQVSLGNQPVLSKGGQNYFVWFNEFGKISFAYLDTSSQLHTFETSATILTDGVWAHVAVTFTWNGSGTLTLYVNATPVSGSWVSGNGSGAPFTNDSALSIGGDGGDPFEGILDEISLWSRKLSAAEIAAYYARQR